MESQGLSNERITPPYKINKILSPKLQWNKYKIRLSLKEDAENKKIQHSYSKQCSKVISSL